MHYTKERIDSAIKQYETMYVEYLQVGITYRVKHYLKKLPEISKKLKCINILDNLDSV